MSNNYAFIDSQNLNMATHTLGWNMDWAKFRAYLKSEFQVEVAYLFMGYMPEHQEMYSSLQKAGYIVVFKPVSVNREGEVKGNIDAELVLQAMIDFERYDGAVIVTGDGDFASLVSHLTNKNKLACILIPNQRQFSPLLKSAAKDKVFYINNLRRDLEYRRYNSHKSSSSTPNTSSSTTPVPQSTQPTSTPQAQASSTAPTPAAPTPPVAPKTDEPTVLSPATAHPSSGSRLASTRSIENALIQATSAPAATSANRRPRTPRRTPKPQSTSQNGTS